MSAPWIGYKLLRLGKAAEFGSPCPRRSQRPCSISSALLSADVLSKSIALTSLENRSLSSSLGGISYKGMEKWIENSFMDLDLINFRVLGSVLDVDREFLDRKSFYSFRYGRLFSRQWKKEIHR